MGVRTFTKRQVSVSAAVLVLLALYPLAVRGSFPMHLMIMVFLFAMLAMAK